MGEPWVPPCREGWCLPEPGVLHRRLMARVWTHGVWTVKPGREEEFVRAWSAMRDQVNAELSLDAQPTLLRDREHSNVFMSFGPWPDVAAVERFRASPAFTENVARIQPLLESFEPQTLDEVVRGG
jgi:quinol monooxygenase YgiN